MSTLSLLQGLAKCCACILIALAAAACSKSPSQSPAQPQAAADPQQAFNEALAQAKQNKGNVDKAAAGYQAFVDRFPDHEYAPLALLNLGQLYHNEADALLQQGTLRKDSDCVQKAVAAYDSFLQRNANHPDASNIQMKKGLLYANSGNTPEAVKAYTEFLERFPNDPQADNVRQKLSALR